MKSSHLSDQNLYKRRELKKHFLAAELSEIPLRLPEWLIRMHCHWQLHNGLLWSSKKVTAAEIFHTLIPKCKGLRMNWANENPLELGETATAPELLKKPVLDEGRKTEVSQSNTGWAVFGKITVNLKNSMITKWFWLGGTLKLTQPHFLWWAGTPPPTPGCSKPHTTFPGIGSPQPLWVPKHLQFTYQASQGLKNKKKRGGGYKFSYLNKLPEELTVQLGKWNFRFAEVMFNFNSSETTFPLFLK